MSAESIPLDFTTEHPWVWSQTRNKTCARRPSNHLPCCLARQYHPLDLLWVAPDFPQPFLKHRQRSGMQVVSRQIVHFIWVSVANKQSVRNSPVQSSCGGDRGVCLRDHVEESGRVSVGIYQLVSTDAKHCVWRYHPVRQVLTQRFIFPLDRCSAAAHHLREGVTVQRPEN